MFKFNIKKHLFFLVFAYIECRCKINGSSIKEKKYNPKPLAFEPTDKLEASLNKRVKEDKLDDKLDKSVGKALKRVENPSKGKRDLPVGNQGKKNTSCAPTKLKHQETSTLLPKAVLVLLHGLTMDTSEEDPITYVAEDTFGKAIEIIQPKCREGIKSAWRSIDTQAKEVIQEIQKTLSCKFPQYSEKELKALPIHLFGYSQGGLVAGIIAADYRDALNIKSLALAHVPLSGTDVLENTKSDINEFNKQAKPGLEAIGYHTKSFFEKIERKLAVSILNGKLSSIGNRFKGIADMRIGSDVCKRITNLLRGEKNGIPTLIMAGCIDPLTEYFDFSEDKRQDVNVLNQQYAKLTTGKEGDEHDILISVRSQLCRTKSFTNLEKSKDDPVYHNNVEKHIDNTLHCYNLMSISSDHLVNYGQIFFHSKKEIDHYINFLAKHNNLDKN